MPDLDHHLRQFARILAGDPTVVVTMNDVVEVMRLTRPELFDGTHVSAFDSCFGGGPSTPHPGPSVLWPDGRVTYLADPDGP